MRNAAQRERGAAHHIAGADIEQRRGADEREIAVAAGEFVEAEAVTLAPERQIDGRDHLVGLRARSP